MTTMRAMQVSEAGGDFELVERPLPEPGAGQVRVAVHACGVCHSDSLAKLGAYPGVSFPVIPGHEIAGVVEALGHGVQSWEVGQRVGVGWFGGFCGHCEACRRGDFIGCANGVIPGVTVDGGYATHVVVSATALASIPDDLADVDAAPLLCAGVTTFNAIRTAAPRAGSLVAVLGIGGLGHLGVQYAARLGHQVVAIARGAEKEPLAKQLGAHIYIDSTASDPAAELQALGGAQLILATVTASDAMASVIGGLGRRGKLIIVGASMDPIEVPGLALIGGDLTIAGHASGTSIDSQDTLAFSAQSGVKPMIETLPLERASEAYEKMMANDARFRMVLTMQS